MSIWQDLCSGPTNTGYQRLLKKKKKKNLDKSYQPARVAQRVNFRGIFFLLFSNFSSFKKKKYK